MNPLETYLRELRDIHSTGAAVPETSYYGPLANLLNEIGKTLKPKVRCVMNPADTGAGVPDGGLFTADQIRKHDPNPVAGQLPARGVLEVKGPADDVRKIARSEQVKRYSARYGLVLVTNYRDFLLLGRDAQGHGLPMEGFTLADTEAAFWQAAAAHPQKAAAEQGERFCEYLKRVMLSVAPLSAPQDVAWFLASYARDAKARVEAAGGLPALAQVREALEEALGMTFTGDKGEHFFRSTLVQTIFYGVFSAWVLWHRERPDRGDAFDWQKSAWSLRVPFIRVLYDEVATPSKLGPLGLVEVLDWTAAALNRVDRAAFFQKFQDEHAVQYFYEPFLEAFDPDLRKEMGVWLTPLEIVRYQVARVDAVLREELGLADGLADPNVIVLDPCCGTAAYVVEVLKKIAETLKAKGGDALIASDLKKAAMTRVFGFEILPAPFVVAHLQLGLLLHNLGAPLSAKGNERVGVYLTNSLTGWEPPKNPKKLLFPELAAERDAANSVKQSTPILVILGNPPYNGFSDVAMDEERDLSLAYRDTKKAPKPQGQGLNDLYVRFFRMAERRIVDKTHRGIVCFISNYSWLDGLSHTGMRERYIEAFDRIWIDCLNGDKYKTGKLTPDGKPDPSVFSTEFNREGIQVGTAITLMVRKEHVAQPVAQPPSAGGNVAQPVAQPPPAGGPVPQPPSAGGSRVAQPPPAVNPGQDPHPVAQAKPSSMRYRRDLPHIQRLYKRLYITFCTRDRWVLPESVRDLVIRHCLHDHGRKYWVHSMVVMPDHVHMIVSLYTDPEGVLYGLPEIMNGIKGASSHSINKALKRKGSVWQDESFDHVLRCSESTSAKAHYIANNPVRSGLVANPEQWPWFWGEWMDLPEGCAPPEQQSQPNVAQPPPAGENVAQPPSAGKSEQQSQPRAAVPHVFFRHLWGKDKRAELLAFADNDGKGLYQTLEPKVELGCPFMPSTVSAAYMNWPTLPELFPFSSPGVNTGCDDLVVEIDKDRLSERMKRYFDRRVSHEEIRRMAPTAMRTVRHFTGEETRAILLKRGFVAENIVRYSYRPFDLRWVYWEPETDLLDRKRPELFAALSEGNVFLTSRQKAEREREGTPFYATGELADRHLTRPGSMCFPLLSPKKAPESLFDGDENHADNAIRRPNLTNPAIKYLELLGVDVAAAEGADLLWMHAMAIGHSPAYLLENAGALWQNFPRIPLPATREALEASAALGRQIAALLDAQAGEFQQQSQPNVAQPPPAGEYQQQSQPRAAVPQAGEYQEQSQPRAAVPHFTTGKISPELKTIGLITHVEGKQINDADDLAVTAGWGNPGRAGITMPAGGEARPRDYAQDELKTPASLGATTFDIYLNENVYWRNIPAAVWEYTLGGYQVIKKWLSYRENKILGRPLRADEARYVTEMSRRIAGILLMHPALDENYAKVKSGIGEGIES